MTGIILRDGRPAPGRPFFIRGVCAHLAPCPTRNNNLPNVNLFTLIVPSATLRPPSKRRLRRKVDGGRPRQRCAIANSQNEKKCLSPFLIGSDSHYESPSPVVFRTHSPSSVPHGFARVENPCKRTMLTLLNDTFEEGIAMCFRPAEAGGFASDGHTCPPLRENRSVHGRRGAQAMPVLQGRSDEHARSGGLHAHRAARSQPTEGAHAAGRPEPARSAFHPQAAFGVIACW